MPNQDTILNEITESLRRGMEEGAPVALSPEHRNVHPKAQTFFLMRKIDRFAPTRGDLEAWTDLVSEIRAERFAFAA